jgi:hypothetical protein
VLVDSKRRVSILVIVFQAIVLLQVHKFASDRKLLQREMQAGSFCESDYRPPFGIPNGGRSVGAAPRERELTIPTRTALFVHYPIFELLSAIILKAPGK